MIDLYVHQKSKTNNNRNDVRHYTKINYLHVSLTDKAGWWNVFFNLLEKLYPNSKNPSQKTPYNLQTKKNSFSFET